jgi:hypothetical protein
VCFARGALSENPPLLTSGWPPNDTAVAFAKRDVRAGFVRTTDC